MKESGLANIFFLHPVYRAPMFKTGSFLLILALIQLLTWLVPPQFGPTGIPGYLPLHSLFETVSIVVAMLVFAVGWNSRSPTLPGNVVLLACVFFAIGWLDFSHTLSYKGMPDFYTANDAQKQLNFWLSARFLASFVLLVVAIRMWGPLRSRATRYWLMSALLGTVLFINWLVLFHQDWLPDTFIPGQGLTPLKKNLEYLFIFFNLITAVILWMKMRTKQSFNVINLFAAVCVMAMSEFFFTLYTTMTGGYNVWGHVYKVISYYFIYRAIVVEVIDFPYSKLEKAQLNLSTALKASNTGLWDWNLRNNEVKYSAEWKAQIGYTETQLEDNFSSWELLLHPEDKVRAIKHAQDFLASNESTYINEFRLLHRNGSYRSILAQGEKQFDAQGKAISLVGSHVDITERMQAVNQFRSVVEASPNGIIMVDEHNLIVLANSEASALFGYSRDELMGQSVHLLLPDELRSAHGDQVKEFMLHASERRKMGDGRELFGLSKAGQMIPVEVGLSPIQNSEGRFVIATVVDISERKQREQEAADMREHVAQATKMESVGHLTAGIAHDFNNILAAMMGYTELAQHMVESGNATAIVRYQKEVLTAGIRAKELIAQMLTFSRASPGSNSGPAPVTLLSTIVKEVVSLLRSSIPRTVDLNYIIEDENLKVRIQPVHLHQIILNLGVNARDALGEYGKIDISLTKRKFDYAHCSSCQMECVGECAQITVTDSGSGIPAEVLKKIFDPFFTTKDIGKGTGMGLSVVHGLVHGLGGHIVVETNSAGGTSFHILLPLVSEDMVSVDTTVATKVTSIKGFRIMVVDDEPTLSSMLYEFLTAQGADVYAFTSPIKALEAFILNPDIVDLVVTDEAMPGISGMLLAEKMLKIKSGLPIILCTGYSEHANAESVAKAGIEGFFHKPLNMNDLVQKIQSLRGAKY